MLLKNDVRSISQKLFMNQLVIHDFKMFPLERSSVAFLHNFPDVAEVNPCKTDNRLQLKLQDINLLEFTFKNILNSKKLKLFIEKDLVVF